MNSDAQMVCQAQPLAEASVDGLSSDATNAVERNAIASNHAARSGELPAVWHARCLLTPGLALVFLCLQPLSAWATFAFVSATFLMDTLAESSSAEARQPPATRAGRPFDLILYALVAIHGANLFLAARLIGDVGWATLEAPAALFMTVLSSGIAASAAHELIHRTNAIERCLGRLLLCSFLFEHFFTEHLRGHHVNAATGHDSASARPDETFLSYAVRNVPGQFVNAWRLEHARLGKMRRPCRNLLRNRVVQGLLLEAAMIGVVLVLFGAGAVVFVLLNAVLAVLIVQVINYVQHWGLERDGPFGASHAWDSVNRSNLFSIVGMARHADHHINPARPYHLLRYHDDSPKLPMSYGRMLCLAAFNNRRFRRIMTEELRRAAERSD